jgi:AAA family ATP:ADP antiporter
VIFGLARRLKLAPEELRLALTLAFALFGITSSYTLVKTARDSIYLAQLPAQTLPYVYLGVGTVTLLTAHFFARLTRRHAVWRTLAVSAAIASASLVACAFLVHVSTNLFPIGFYLWVNIYGLILTSQFWAFANSASDPRLAKRIFGLIGVGGILGGLMGGLLAGSLVHPLGLGGLLSIAAALVATTVPIVLRGVHRGETPLGEATAAAERPQKPWRSAYVRWFAFAALCSVIVTGLLDYQLKVEVQHHFPTRHGLAVFFGVFYALTNLGALTVQVLMTRWALDRLGASWSALVLPAGLGIGAVTTLFSTGALAVMATRLWDQMIRLSLNKSAIELFYFPLEPALRRHTKAVIEAGLERIGDGIAAILILAVTFAFGLTTWTLAMMVAIVVAAWLFAWNNLRVGYARELERNLRRLKLTQEHTVDSLRERALLKETVRLLDSPYERVALQGMDLLEENAMRLLEHRLPRLLEHPSSRVRIRALTLIAAVPSEEARERVKALLNDADPLVRLEALRTYSVMHGKGKSIAALEPFLDSDQAELRATALQCLAQLAPPREESRVRAIIERRLASDRTEERIAAIEAIALRPPPSTLHELLQPLFEDRDLEVRRAALRAAGRLGERKYVTRLIRTLAVHEVGHAARDGLAAMGVRVVGTLGDHLLDPSVPIEVRRGIADVLGDIPAPESVHALFRYRDRQDVALAFRVLKACNRIRTADPKIGFPADLVREDLEYEFRTQLFLLVHYRECPVGTESERFLCVVMNERLGQTINRIFRRLALIYSPTHVYAAYRGIVSSDPLARGPSLEYLDTVLTIEDRKIVLPLVDETKDVERMRLAEELYGFRYRGYENMLRQLMEGDDPWLRICALYVVGQRRDRSLADRIEANLEAQDPRVRETAEWARMALATG